MNFIQKSIKILNDPHELKLYLKYTYSKLCKKNIVRTINIGQHKVLISGFQNFTEYNTCTRALNKQDQLCYNFISSHLTGQDVVLFDIGANLGVVSAYLAKLYPEADIYSFEPSPVMYQALQSTIHANGFTNIRAENMAVTDIVGEVLFNTHPDCRATAKISNSDNQNSNIVSVDATTLDAFVIKEKIDHIDFLKVDVEGFEAKVFEGAQDLLQNKKIDYIYFEYCSLLEKAANIPIGSTLEILEKNGYSFYTITEDGIQAMSKQAIMDVKMSNWLATYKDL